MPRRLVKSKCQEALVVYTGGRIQSVFIGSPEQVDNRYWNYVIECLIEANGDRHCARSDIETLEYYWTEYRTRDKRFSDMCRECEEVRDILKYLTAPGEYWEATVIVPNVYEYFI